MGVSINWWIPRKAPICYKGTPKKGLLISKPRHMEAVKAIWGPVVMADYGQLSRLHPWMGAGLSRDGGDYGRFGLRTRRTHTTEGM